MPQHASKVENDAKVNIPLGNGKVNTSYIYISFLQLVFPHALWIMYFSLV